MRRSRENHNDTFIYVRRRETGARGRGVEATRPCPKACSSRLPPLRSPSRPAAAVPRRRVRRLAGFARFRTPRSGRRSLRFGQRRTPAAEGPRRHIDAEEHGEPSSRHAVRHRSIPARWDYVHFHNLKPSKTYCWVAFIRPSFKSSECAGSWHAQLTRE